VPKHHIALHKTCLKAPSIKCITHCMWLVGHDDYWRQLQREEH
jgi:hypothetical protein